jgi:UDP-N-acetyl-D-mannosaminuronic acid dehydrogenase
MTHPYQTVSIIGLGYIGLPTAAMFASRKVKVIGVDMNQHAVDTINRGEIHIVEPDLDMVVHAAVKEGYLRATTLPEPADAFLIAVPTPFKDGPSGPHHPDMDYIEAATKSIAPVLECGNLVILESTSPVGATEQMAAWLAEMRPDLSFPQTHGEASDIRIAHCPERVLPGHVLRELVQNDRVIGGLTPRCSHAARTLYKKFVEGECHITNARTAEMCKLTENSFRDVNIAFANELSIVCDKLNISVWELINLANRHPRVKILQPGPGVGGHCIAVDPWFIVSSAPAESRLISTARLVNDHKPSWVIEKIRTIIDELRLKPINETHEKNRNITVACYGIAFKADIDDLRESPAALIAEELSKIKDLNVLIVEPNITALPRELLHCSLVNLEMAMSKSDIHLMLVDHSVFKSGKPKTGKIFDTRGIWL